MDRPSGPVLYTAASVRDAAGVNATPGAVALDAQGAVIAAGSVDEVVRAAPSDITRVERPNSLLLPGLVNAHVHLDLTHIGPQPYSGDFIEWVKMVMRERASDAEAIGQSVRSGIERSLAAGVLTVGDIAGSPQATRCLIDSPLRGVSYMELFGLGVNYIQGDTTLADQLYRWAQPIDGRLLDETANIRIGQQPHAPYSAGPGLYEMAAGSHRLNGGTPIATHLAETPEELEFVATGRGPFHDLLVSMEKWHNAYDGLYGEGLHPVQWLHAYGAGSPLLGKDIDKLPAELRPKVLPRAAWLCEHCNYIEDEHIRIMADRGWSVAYCPRASDYFGHTGHRYREMLDAGVNVCLGTDSIICHGTLSILDEMRHLYQRDHTDPAILLAMATVNGMRGLQMPPRQATFDRGARPGLIAIDYDAQAHDDALTAVLKSREPVIDVLAVAS